jgi:hypothetical protein
MCNEYMKTEMAQQFLVQLSNILSRDSIVGIATGYQLKRPRGQSSSPSGVKNFLFSKLSRLALGSIQPPIQWVLGALSPGVKRQGREADHSPPTSAKVKKMSIYTSTPHGILLN